MRHAILIGVFGYHFRIHVYPYGVDAQIKIELPTKREKNITFVDFSYPVILLFSLQVQARNFLSFSTSFVKAIFIKFLYRDTK